MQNDIREILLAEEQVKKRVIELGQQIARDYRDRDLVAICVLKGAVMFFADLLRAVSIPLNVDFMAISSYGASTKTSGVHRIIMDLERSIEGKDVLLVEDIVDTGRTLAYMRNYLAQRNPASLRVCVLLDKSSRREVEVPVEYKGFDIPDKFVVGYGLDYAETYRNLPYICVLKPEVYSKGE
jgi:hypoxanthine phosphoribosyltransferase